MQPLCHDDESSALLQFKESFIINKSASSDDPFAYPKVKSWTLEGESSDCCSWDGVSCDEDTGHVLALTSVAVVSMVQSTLTAVSSVLFTYKALTLLTITLTTLKSHPR
jgi:hypothetical protein